MEAAGLVRDGWLVDRAFQERIITLYAREENISLGRIIIIDRIRDSTLLHIQDEIGSGVRRLIVFSFNIFGISCKTLFRYLTLILDRVDEVHSAVDRSVITRNEWLTAGSIIKKLAETPSITHGKTIPGLLEKIMEKANPTSLDEAWRIYKSVVDAMGLQSPGKVVFIEEERIIEKIIDAMRRAGP